MNPQPTETTIVKQMIINQVSFPDLVLAEIKDYLFYDIQSKAYQQLLSDKEQTRKHKEKLLKNIRQSYTSHNMVDRLIDEYEEYEYDDNFDYDNLEEFLKAQINPVIWYFRLWTDGDFEIEANFCLTCGDYKQLEYQIHMSNNCKCKCPRTNKKQIPCVTPRP